MMLKFKLKIINYELYTVRTKLRIIYPHVFGTPPAQIHAYELRLETRIFVIKLVGTLAIV